MIALLFAAFLTQAPTNGQLTITTHGFKSAEQLYEACHTKGSNSFALVRRMSCLSYVSGIADVSPVATGLFYNKTGKLIGLFCLPNTVSAGQVEQAVVSWLDADADHRKGGAAWSVVLALSNRFPCSG